MKREISSFVLHTYNLVPNKSFWCAECGGYICLVQMPSFHQALKVKLSYNCKAFVFLQILCILVWRPILDVSVTPAVITAIRLMKSSYALWWLHTVLVSCTKGNCLLSSTNSQLLTLQSPSFFDLVNITVWMKYQTTFKDQQ